MARRPDGHNLSCGAMLSIEICCILLAVILASDNKAKGSESFIVIMIGAVVSYAILIQEIRNRRFTTKQNNKSGIFSLQTSGGYCDETVPLTIPKREVKLVYANGTT